MRGAALVAPPGPSRTVSTRKNLWRQSAMPRFAFVLLLALAACAQSDTGVSAIPVDMQDWRFATGKPPTRAEYAAIVAACQDGAVKRSRTAPFEACLAHLGLKRTPGGP